jgi:hypothetical protein
MVTAMASATAATAAATAAAPASTADVDGERSKSNVTAGSVQQGGHCGVTLSIAAFNKVGDHKFGDPDFESPILIRFATVDCGISCYHGIVF